MEYSEEIQSKKEIQKKYNKVRVYYQNNKQKILLNKKTTI